VTDCEWVLFGSAMTVRWRPSRQTSQRASGAGTEACGSTEYGAVSTQPRHSSCIVSPLSTGGGGGGGESVQCILGVLARRWCRVWLAFFLTERLPYRYLKGRNANGDRTDREAKPKAKPTAGGRVAWGPAAAPRCPCFRFARVACFTCWPPGWLQRSNSSPDAQLLLQ
jgi:hypothetical protein